MTRKLLSAMSEAALAVGCLIAVGTFVILLALIPLGLGYLIGPFGYVLGGLVSFFLLFTSAVLLDP
jgi:hypothetical protein